MSSISACTAEAEARAAMETVWKPGGGVWAAFLGDPAGTERPHVYVWLGQN